MELHPPPAAVDDFSRRPSKAAAMAEGWDAVVDDWLDDVVADLTREDSPSLFYNPRSDSTPGEPITDSAVWDAFPEVLSLWFGGTADKDEQRWLCADTLRPTRSRYHRVVDGQVGDRIPIQHRQQDEYCEWHVVREGDTIRRVAFTSEAPEYWTFLADGTAPFFPEEDPRSKIFAGDIDLVVELYQEYVDESVQKQDLVWPFEVAVPVRNRQGGVVPRLLPVGSYNPYNKWNTTDGAMHLTHPSNTLGAEITLAGDATVQREDVDPDDALALVCCAGYGNVNRSSDPIIGAKVYDLADQGLSVTLPDPIGLYIAGWDESFFRGPGDEDLAAAWDVPRGDRAKRRILRAVFEVPSDFDFTVERVEAQGIPIQWGGQIADAMQVHLTAAAKNRQLAGIKPVKCEKQCCEHPDKPGFRDLVKPGEDCGADWDSLGPFLPSMGISEVEETEKVLLAAGTPVEQLPYSVHDTHR